MARPVDTANRERRRADIIEAASELFSSIGFADATIKDIAENAGVSKGTVTHYFPRKLDIINAAVEAAKMALESDPNKSAQRALALITEINGALTSIDTNHLTPTRVLIADSLR
jgi:AcrR family transcriptional regulator